MKQMYLYSKRKLNPALYLILLFLGSFINFSGNAQTFSPANCNNIQCTSNDVRVISAYLSGPDNAAIDCSKPQPFLNAELHLIVSSNTQRIGVSISGSLNADGKDYPIGQCYGEKLNNGSNNNLVYQLADQLADADCGASFSLNNLFTSWGTGNTNFCTSGSPQCPATPAKCRYKQGEVITVDVKLDVDFSWNAGDCSKNENGLNVAFSPTVTAENITYPLTLDWDFGDETKGQTSASSAADVANAGTTHTYTKEGSYIVILKVTDATTGTVIEKSTHYTITVASCCTLSAPDLTVGPYCSADKKTVADLPQDDGNGGTYHWYDGADPSSSFELDPTTVLANGAVYYVSVSDATCESPRTKVTLVVNDPVTAKFDAIDPVCSGSSIVLPTTSTNGITGTWSPAVDNTQTTTYTFTPNAGQCATGTTLTVTVNAAPTATVSVNGSQTCTGGIAQFALKGTVANAGSYTWSNNGGDGSFNPASGSLTPTYTPGANDRINGVTITLTANPVSGSACTTAVTSAGVKLQTTPCGPYYTYTQGYYGNTGGTSCTPNGTRTTLQLIQQSLDNIDGISNNATGMLYLGKAGASFTLSYANASKLITIMPGGGTAGKLAGNYNLSATTTYPPLKSGKISNVLLSQSITLALNINIPGNGLGSLVLQNGYLTTITKSGTSCTAAAATCTNGVISSKKITASAALAALLNGKTVNDLLIMASNALGGTLPAGVTYTDISGAVDVINNSFDGGRYSLGFFPAQKTCTSLTPTTAITLSNRLYNNTVAEAPTSLSVTTYPNPYSTTVRFVVNNPKAGQGSLDLFNMLGQKVNTIYRGFIPAGTQTYNLNVSSLHQANLVYRLSVGNTQVTGKLLHVKE